MQSIYIILPGLISPFDKNQNSFIAKSDFRSLSRLLTKSSIQDVAYNNIESCLKYHFGILQGGELPYGALGALANNLCLINQNDYWLRADLVTLQVASNSLYLKGNAYLDISVEDTDNLYCQLKPFLLQDNIILHNVAYDQWYLQTKILPEISTNSLLEVIGKNVQELLPTGPDQQYWLKVLTECQMLLKQNIVNKKRALSGEDLANSLWLWGAGGLLTDICCNYAKIFTNHETVQGLAKLTNTVFLPMPNNFGELQSLARNNNSVLLFDIEFLKLLKYSMFDKWVEYAKNYEKQWFTPICDALKSGNIREIILDFVDGNRYIIKNGI